jgi:fructosamine-3-kinase
VLDELRQLGRADRISAISRLPGSIHADVRLITYADGTQVIGKIIADADPGLFAAEAGRRAGRAARHRAAGYSAGPGRDQAMLLLEAMGPRDDSERSWEQFAADLAAAHRSTTGNRFGWHRDGYLGRLRQLNPWTDSGHEFFAEYRLLRFLREPGAERALTTADRRALERLCDRLAEIIPVMPAVLTHGDLWAGNLVGQPGGRITVIDPAVSCTWAEVDLSMLWGCPRPPAADRFFGLYQELNPSPPGWTERMPVLHLRELLSCIAAFGPAAAAHISQTRDILAPFYRR